MNDDLQEVWDLLQNLKTQSTDADTQVAAVVTDGDGVVLCAGTNKHTHGIFITEENSTRPEKYDWIEHAERIAIFDAAYAGVTLDGTRMYIEGFPCVECARAIVMSGVKELWHGSTEGFDPVKYKFDKSRQILEGANVTLKDWSEIMTGLSENPAEA